MDDTTIIQWLLASPIPSIRYQTLRDLQYIDEHDVDLRSLKLEMMHSGPIPAILEGQSTLGNWSHERGYYTPKYTSTHWSMMLLAELNADGTDARLQRGAGHMLTAIHADLVSSIAEDKTGYACFWGNLLRYTLHCHFDDDRIEAVISHLYRSASSHDWRCPHNDDEPCAWGVARALWGLAVLQSEKRSTEVEETITSGLAFLLDAYDLVKADYPDANRIHELWFRLNFPLFYQADILFVLRVVAELDAIHHPGARPALEWLLERRLQNGRWRGASPYRQRTWSGLADREATDRWVSLQATRILQAYQG